MPWLLLSGKLSLQPLHTATGSPLPAAAILYELGVVWAAVPLVAIDSGGLP